MKTTTKPRARRKLPTLLGGETKKLIAKHKADSIEYEMGRTRRKKPSGFYTPIDGWKPNPRGMLELRDRLLRIVNASRRADPWSYWAAVREHIV